MSTLPPGWDYPIDVLSDLLRDADERGVSFEHVLSEARRRNETDDRDAVGRAGEDPS